MARGARRPRAADVPQVRVVRRAHRWPATRSRPHCAWRKCYPQRPPMLVDVSSATPRFHSRELWRSLLRPHARDLALLSLLSVAEIVLRIGSPWALMAVVDHALGGQALRGWLAAAVRLSGVT